MSEELKPCPFCGGEAKFVESRDSVIPGKLEVVAWKVKCSKCGASTLPNNHYGDKKEAANRWNTRSERTCHFRNDGHGILWCDAEGCDYDMDDYFPIPNYCPNCGAKVVEVIGNERYNSAPR